MRPRPQCFRQSIGRAAGAGKRWGREPRRSCNHGRSGRSGQEVRAGEAASWPLRGSAGVGSPRELRDEQFGQSDGIGSPSLLPDKDLRKVMIGQRTGAVGVPVVTHGLGELRVFQSDGLGFVALLRQQADASDQADERLQRAVLDRGGIHRGGIQVSALPGTRDSRDCSEKISSFRRNPREALMKRTIRRNSR